MDLVGFDRGGWMRLMGGDLIGHQAGGVAGSTLRSSDEVGN